MWLDGGLNKHHGILCTETLFTTAAFEAKTQCDTQIFGEEFYQSSFYVIQKDLHVDERANCTKKNPTFFAKKKPTTPTQPVNKAKYSPKKGITLILCLLY